MNIDMNSRTPKVSIGMPIYNGEHFLPQTLDSLLAQTYKDFELIISDNASSDGTQEICQKYAAQDPRIRYLRQSVNLGASQNFNHVFDLASGEYFKWAAHDDLCAPEYLARCVEVLDRDPQVILCYTQAQAIDEEGQVVRQYMTKPNLQSSQAYIRYVESLTDDNDITVVPIVIFGLIRRDVLAKTPLIGNYASSDGVLLGELALHGRFHEVPECLFSYRHHAEQSWVTNPDRRSLEGWYDPKRARKITFPKWRLLKEHLHSIHQGPVNWDQRFRCYVFMMQWMMTGWRELVKNLVLRG
jgi:glycosyltransferase involved in cell wall biosynthesis